MKLPFGIKEAIRVIHTRKTRDWCKIPYLGHKKGCPNYGKKEGCPPIAPFITEIMDLRRPVYIAFSEFYLPRHIAKMRERHPRWTERQLRNVLYWQQMSRKQMRNRARIAQFYGGGEKGMKISDIDDLTEKLGKALFEIDKESPFRKNGKWEDLPFHRILHYRSEAEKVVKALKIVVKGETA